MTVAPDDLPRLQPGAEEVRRTADEVLSRAEFRPPPRSIQERVLDWVFDRIGDALGALVGGGRGALVAWAIMLVATGLLGFFAVRFATGVRRDAAQRFAEAVEPRRPAADWRAEAAAHEARGEWKAALRCRYRALVADLAARGLVDEIPGRTAGEYRREVRRALPDASGEFGSATDLFEWAWYGNRPTGADENARFRSLADDVLTRAGA